MSGDHLETPVWRDTTKLKNREIYWGPHIISPFELRDLSDPQRVFSLRHGYTDIGSYEGSLIKLDGEGINPSHATIKISKGSHPHITLFMRAGCQIMHRRDDTIHFYNYGNEIIVLRYGDIITFGSTSCFKLVQIKYIAGN